MRRPAQGTPESPPPGAVLAELPSGGDTGFRKDANDVLVLDGPEQLRGMVEHAEAMPVNGLRRFSDYYDDILKLYEQKCATRRSHGAQSCT